MSKDLNLPKPTKFDPEKFKKLAQSIQEDKVRTRIAGTVLIIRWLMVWRVSADTRIKRRIGYGFQTQRIFMYFYTKLYTLWEWLQKQMELVRV